MRFCHCLVLLTILVAAQGLTDEQKKKIDSLGGECRLKTGVSQEIVLKALDGEFEEDSKLKLFMLCVGKKIGMLDESGEIVIDTLRTNVIKVSKNNEEVDAIMSKCVVKKNTPEDSIFHLVKCLLKAKPQFSPI